METDKAPLSDCVANLRTKINDRFSGLAIDGALCALADEGNPLRLSFFSTAMRILFEHIMDTLSPNDQVMKASWFKSERDNGQPTRRQRVTFAIQGGLSDNFVQKKLKLDLTALRKRLLDSVDELSKHVHGRQDTVISDPSEQELVAGTMTRSMNTFLDAMRDCRGAVLQPIASALDNAAVDAFLSETIMEVDELATHHSVDELYVEDISVSAIGADSITYRVVGSLVVTLQWGSNSDVRRGDGAEAETSFPFGCQFRVPLDDPWDLGMAELTYGVDTASWHKAMAPDEWE